MGNDIAPRIVLGRHSWKVSIKKVNLGRARPLRETEITFQVLLQRS